MSTNGKAELLHLECERLAVAGGSVFVNSETIEFCCTAYSRKQLRLSNHSNAHEIPFNILWYFLQHEARAFSKLLTIPCRNHCPVSISSLNDNVFDMDSCLV